MSSNLGKYKTDLESLIKRGLMLSNAIQFECYPQEFKKEFTERSGDGGKKSHNFDAFKKTLPSFIEQYQNWYSESLALIKQLLPDRLLDFTRLYEKPKNRKEIDNGNYVIEDYLQGLTITRSWDKAKLVGPDAAIPCFQQQLNILKSISRRFESSLFNIRQLVQADIFDSELDAARELIKSGFLRAAGAMAGVVLEKHLAQVCASHNLSISKKAPHISDFNDILKHNDVIDIAVWRFIQHLGDIRNLCDHNKNKEPTDEEVRDLIVGVDKICKTVF
jgi:hypothetical protein